MTNSFQVCPLTGLSFTLLDDCQASLLIPAAHPITKEPEQLYRLVETKQAPKSYIIAGIILKLEAMELVAHAKSEPSYCRGHVNELLQQIGKFRLTELYWAARNSRAHLCGSPIKINLATAVQESPWSLFHGIMIVAAQSVKEADYANYLRRSTTHTTKSKVETIDWTPVGCCKRAKALLPTLVGPESVTTAESATKAARLLGIDSVTKRPTYNCKAKAIRDRLAEIIGLLIMDALVEGTLERDSIEHRTMLRVMDDVEAQENKTILDEEF